MISLFVWLISHQPAVLFLSEQISHQQQANSTFLSQQISTSHQPPAKRTGWMSSLLLLRFFSCKPVAVLAIPAQLEGVLHRPNKKIPSSR
jgi:hypothetical protein